MFRYNVKNFCFVIKNNILKKNTEHWTSVPSFCMNINCYHNRLTMPGDCHQHLFGSFN